MATLKTTRTEASVEDFLGAITDERRRDDAQRLCALLTRVTGVRPAMWGTSIVGFGDQHLRYASGRELDWFLVGFSPRARNLTLYLGGDAVEDEQARTGLGRHTVGKGCLYVNRLDDVDLDVLAELVRRSLPAAPAG